MEYKKGFTTKPYKIERNGLVTFTDGTHNNLASNQLTCEAYGYTFDSVNGTCKAYNFTPKVHTEIAEKSTNKFVGSKNNPSDGTMDSLFSGSENTAKGNNINCLLTGEKNEIDRGLENSSVFGKMGKATHSGEVVIGGGGRVPGELQHIEIQISNSTTDATVTSLFVQGGTSHIFPPTNSICIYEMYLTALCTGGSSGTAGHYKTEKHLGSILKENDNTQTLVSSSITAISSSGTTGTAAIVVGAGDIGMQVNVTGTAATNIQWSATVHLYINKTAVEI